MIEKQKQDVSDVDLVAQDLKKIRWAEMHQRLHQMLRIQFSETKPLI